jgi:hypothetical protein
MLPSPITPIFKLIDGLSLKCAGPVLGMRRVWTAAGDRSNNP